MTSIHGRPDMDMELDGGANEDSPAANGNEWSDCDPDDVGDDDCSDDDMDEWGAPPTFLASNGNGNGNGGESPAADGRPSPPSMLTFDAAPILKGLNDRPTMPMLSEEELPIGTHVWVCDSEDVALCLKGNWDGSHNLVCCGKSEGVVVRHSCDMTLVRFDEFGTDGVLACMTIPRTCLSKEKITPYDNDYNATKAQGFGVGTLGPKAGNRPQAKAMKARPMSQYYDVMSSSKVDFESTKACVEYMLDSRFDGALEMLNKLLSSGKVEAKEVLYARCVCYVFLDDAAAALNDALKIIESSPSWPRGYLAAARAYLTLGKISQSSQMLNQVHLLLPNANDVVQLVRINDILMFQQRQIDAHAGVFLRLDAEYNKLLKCRRAYSPGDVILEDIFVAAVPSIFNVADACEYCLGPLPEDRLASSCDNSINFCTRECFDSAVENFHATEHGTASISFRSARMLVHNKASASLQITPLEIANLTIRVCAQLLTAIGNGCTRDTLENHINGMRLCPASPVSFDSKQMADLGTLHNVLSGSLSDAVKELFTKELLVEVYSYCAKNHVATTVSGSGATAFILPAFAGNVQRRASGFNAEVTAGPGYVRLIAARDIDAGETISIFRPETEGGKSA